MWKKTWGSRSKNTGTKFCSTVSDPDEVIRTFLELLRRMWISLKNIEVEAICSATIKLRQKENDFVCTRCGKKKTVYEAKKE